MAQEEPKLNNNEDPSTGSGQVLQDLKKDLKDAKEKCEEYLNGWKRERADFLNHKKDEMERIGHLVEYANEELILKMIPILDNIFLAESHIPDDLKKTDWLDGFSQIKKQLCDCLEKEGIEVVKTLDRPFDPNTMEAVETVPSTATPGNVVEEVQRGYTMHGKVIRPAKVKIAN